MRRSHSSRVPSSGHVWQRRGRLGQAGQHWEPTSAYFGLDDAWLDALCRRPSGRILNFGDVEDAAYWRRAQQLITAAAGGTGERNR